MSHPGSAMFSVNQPTFGLVGVVWSYSVLLCVFSLDVKPQQESYIPDYSHYHNLSAIGKTVSAFAKRHPRYVRHVSRFLSKEGRIQHLLHIKNFTSHSTEASQHKVKVLLSYGEHAREFLPIESLIYVLHKFTKRKESKHVHEDNDLWSLILTRFDLYVIVMGNPDGRQYVENTKNYCWRGTSTGVDLNRNFAWEFGGKGSSDNPKDEEYRGAHAFSEPECQIYKELTYEVQFDAFVSFHSGIHQIYVPYADTKSQQLGRRPKNIQAMLELASQLAKSTSHRYTYGEAVHLNEYTADGTVFDYMAGVRQIPFSYAIELWGPEKHVGLSCFDMFNPENSRIQEVVEEIYPLYGTLFTYLAAWKTRTVGSGETKLKVKSSSGAMAQRDTTEVPSLTPMYVLLVGVVIVTVLVAIHGRYPVCRNVYQRRRIVSLRSLSSTFSTSLFQTYR